MRRTLLAVALTTATAQRKLFSQLPAEFDAAFDHEPLFIPAASQPDDGEYLAALADLATPQSVYAAASATDARSPTGDKVKMPGSHEGCAHHLEDGGSFVVKYEKLSDAALAEPAAAPLVGAWRDVADRFKTAASMHVYVTGSGGKALPPHTDTTDVLVAQLRGSKEWQVCAPSKDKAPFASTAFRAELLEAERGSHGCSQFEQELRDEPELACETHVLAPGDSLYLPKGVAHSAVATDDSAHLTVGLKRVTWRRVFDEYLDQPGLFGAESGWANRRLFSVFRGQKAPPTRRARAKRALKTLEAAGDASAVPWRRAFPTWTLGFDDGQAVPGRDAYQQRDALAKALVEALGGDEDLAQALADDDKFVEAVRATFESPKSLGSQPAVLDAGACDEQAFVAGAARRRAQTAAAVDWEAMHPSASANTLTLAAGQTATFTWEDNHDVWEFKDEASYNACNFAGAVEKASTSVKTVDISPGTTTAQTRYYGCSVGSHCDDGQKIAISWTDADGCLSHENYECDSNCDGSCDECNEGCDDGCNEDCDEDSSGNYCSSWEYGCNYDCDQNCNTGCDEECNDKCDGSCDDSCSCKDADAAAARAVSSGAALLALAALLL